MNFLKQLEKYLLTKVTSDANLIDSDTASLRRAFDGLGELGFLAIAAPREIGGLGLRQRERFLFTELLARYSGALRFLQAQQQTAVSLLYHGDAESLRKEWVPKLAKGERRLGIAVAHLRRLATEEAIGIPNHHGYRVNGHFRWVTGYQLFHHVIIGFFTPEQKEVLAIIPFENNSEIKVSDPIETAVMQSVNTVTLTLNNYFLPSEAIVSVREKGSFSSRAGAAAQHLPAYSGLALAALDCAKHRCKGDAILDPVVEHLTTKLKLCRKKCMDEEPLQISALRAELSSLTLKALETAILTTGGAAVTSKSPVQRLFREYLQCSVTGINHQRAQEMLKISPRTSLH